MTIQDIELKDVRSIELMGSAILGCYELVICSRTPEFHTEVKVRLTGDMAERLLLDMFRAGISAVPKFGDLCLNCGSKNRGAE